MILFIIDKVQFQNFGFTIGNVKISCLNFETIEIKCCSFLIQFFNGCFLYKNTVGFCENVQIR